MMTVDTSSETPLPSVDSTPINKVLINESQSYWSLEKNYVLEKKLFHRHILHFRILFNGNVNFKKNMFLYWLKIMKRINYKRKYINNQNLICFF